MKSRPVSVVGIVVGSLLIAACGADSTLEIRPRGSLEDSTGLAGLTLVVDGRVLTAGSFQQDESGLLEARIDVPDAGRLEIVARLEQSGELVSDGTFGWRMADGWEWGMDVFRQVSDPTETCFGCAGSARLDIAPSAASQPAEALWFVWGGKPRDSDIVF